MPGGKSGIEPVQGQALEQRALGSERHRRILGILREQHLQILGRKMQQQPRAENLAAEIAGELQIHELAPDERVRGPPLLGRRADQVILGRKRALPRRQVRVDAVGVGRERRLHFGRQHRELRLGGAVEAERAHGAVDAERARAQHFRQSPRAIAPHHVHREEPLLRVQKSQREIGVVLALARGSSGCRARRGSRAPAR